MQWLLCNICTKGNKKQFDGLEPPMRQLKFGSAQSDPDTDPLLVLLSNWSESFQGLEIDLLFLPLLDSCALGFIFVHKTSFCEMAEKDSTFFFADRVLHLSSRL